MDFKDKQRLSRLKERFTQNGRVSRLFSDYLNIYPEFINKEIMDTLMDGAEFTKKDGVIALLSSLFSLDISEYDGREIINGYLYPAISVMESDKYIENPYYEKLRGVEVKYRDWELRWEKYPAYRAFVSGDMVTLDDYREFAPIGFFTRDFDFPAVLEGKNEWMTLTPVDVDTCEGPLNRAHGKVVTFGLGLGYFAYMAARKSEVESVTVIEKSEDVIKLFTDYVLPRLENRDKIRIISDDAFSYAEREMPRERYDYAFVDTWRDASDGAPMYERMKRLERLSPNTSFDYWVENFLVSRLRALKFEQMISEPDKYESYDAFISELEKGV